MSTLIRKQLKEELQAQLISQFEVLNLEDQYALITPVLYPDNSHVNLYVDELAEGRLALTDNGEAADYAFVHGFSETEILNRVHIARRRFGLLQSEGDELHLEVSRDQLAEAVFALATAVQDVAYLVYRNRDY